MKATQLDGSTWEPTERGWAPTSARLRRLRNDRGAFREPADDARRSGQHAAGTQPACGRPERREAHAPDRQVYGPVARAVAVFAATGLAALIVLGVLATLAVRRIAAAEAVDNARALTEGWRVAASSSRHSPRSSSAVTGAALRRLDRVVRDHVLSDSVVRIKLWDATGRIVYSDEPRLIGERFPLGEDERHSLRTGEVDVDVSDLSEPENRYERNEDTLLEVYLPLRGPDGEQLLFELYERRSSIEAGGTRLLRSLAPWLLLTGSCCWSCRRRWPGAWRGACAAGRRSASGCSCARSSPRRWSGGASPPTCTTAWCRTWRASRSASRPWPRRTARPAPRRACARRWTACGAASAACARCWSRSTRPTCAPSGSRRRSRTSPARCAHGVESRIAIEADDLGADDEALVFRVAQEALRNVSRARRRDLRRRPARPLGGGRSGCS